MVRKYRDPSFLSEKMELRNPETSSFNTRVKSPRLEVIVEAETPSKIGKCKPQKNNQG